MKSLECNGKTIEVPYLQPLQPVEVNGEMVKMHVYECEMSGERFAWPQKDITIVE